MNFSEFKRLLNSDPDSQDPEYQAARRSDPEFVRAAAESDVFEQRLSRASRLPVDPGLTDTLKALAKTAPQAGPSLLFRFRYALAAVVVLALAAILLVPQLRPPQETVEAYVVRHFHLDGYKLLQQTGAPHTEEQSVMLASIGLQMSPELAAQVQSVKYCKTPEGVGVHLTMNSPRGLITIIFMPDLVVPEGQHFAFNDMAAELINLTGQHVSAAIIGHPGQLDPELGLALRQGVVALATGV